MMDQRQIEREKTLFKYSGALERGDFEVVAAILQEAENDAVLEELILEINEVYQMEQEQQQFDSLRKNGKGKQNSLGLRRFNVIWSGLAAVFVLVFISISILTLSGPIIGNTFSDVVSSLDIDSSGGGVRPSDNRQRSVPAVPSPAATSMPSLDSPPGGPAHEASAPTPTAMPLGTATPGPDMEFQASLTAGEIDDNEDFSAYLQYRLDFFRFASIPVHDVDVSERHTINVRTRGGLPVLGAEVLVYDGQDLVVALRTPATGIVRFHPLAYGAFGPSLTVTVQKDQASTSFELARDSQDMTWDVTLDVQPAKAPVKLDVLFLIDATGSMADEIDQLKNNILSISAQVAALPSRPDLRFGMVTYRDRGDEYITRVTDFTDDVEEFQAELRNVYAAGGGDEPESLNEGLHRAIWDVDWRVEDAVKLVFLIADAAPHLDYAQDFDYAQEMQAAAELGIKIHPIASSGLSTQGEFIFRQIGQFTGGHFIFLTYTETPQSSGEPGTEHHVQEGTYSVEFLDALVVRLIQDELAVLFGQ